MAALIPRHFKDLNAAHYASKIAYSTLHAWKTGEREPKWSQVEAVAATVGLDAYELIGGGATGVRGQFQSHPEFRGAVEEAKRRRAGRLPDYAYDYAGATSGARWPEHLTWADVYQLAEFWFNTVGDEELMNAETDAVKAEMAAEDAAVLARIEAGKPANAPPPAPAKPAAKGPLVLTPPKPAPTRAGTKAKRK